MRVMELVSGLGVNGAVVHCLESIRQLARRGHEVTLVCRPGAWIAGQLADVPVEIVSTDFRRWPLAEAQRIARLARSREVQVLHCHQTRAQVFSLLLRWECGIPVVAAAQNRYLQLHWRWCDLVLAASSATADFHRRWNFVPPDRLALAPNFIDAPRFAAPPATARADVRREWGLAEEDLVLGVIAAVIPRKGLAHLVEAFPAIRRQFPRAQIVAVGSQQAEYAERVRQTAERLGVADGLLFVPPRSDMPAVLSALDLFVLPTLEETMPLSILEAMAAGVPVLSTTVGGIPECAGHGAEAWLVPPSRPAALAQAATQLLSDPPLREGLVAAAKARVEAEFSVAARLPELEAALARIADRPRPEPRPQGWAAALASFFF